VLAIIVAGKSRESEVRREKRNPAHWRRGAR
jgi:hypothetical protein